jgi:hypothetical protein
MHYFEMGWNYQLPSTFYRRPLAWGKHHEGDTMDRGPQLHIDSEIGCGGSLMGGGHRLPLCDHHWRAWVTVFRKQCKPVIEPHGDPFKDNKISLDNDRNPPSMRQVS